MPGSRRLPSTSPSGSARRPSRGRRSSPRRSRTSPVRRWRLCCSPPAASVSPSCAGPWPSFPPGAAREQPTGRAVTTVVIADDQELLRSGFRVIIDAEPDLRVVGEAADGFAAIEVVRRRRPDVVLMDIRMPGLDGLRAAEKILGDPESTSAVVMLTTFDVQRYVYEALRLGASGFLLKDAPADRLLDAIRVAAAGEALLAPTITRRLVERFAAGERPLDGRRSRASRHPDRTGARGPAPDRPRTLQRRDRRRPRARREHGQDPRRPHLLEAPPARPRPGGDRRLRDRARPARPRQRRALASLPGRESIVGCRSGIHALDRGQRLTALPPGEPEDLAGDLDGWWNDHGVDDVDDAVGGLDVRFGDFGGAVEVELAGFEGERDLLSFE